jgi:formyltetrahydrofolate deformylase
MDTHIVLIDCADRKGLVHNITGVFYRNGHNITSNAEFVDGAADHFFMRTEVVGNLDATQITSELCAVLPSPVAIRITRRVKQDIVVFVSREHHCLADLLIRHSYGELNANVQAVVSNHATLEPLACRFDVPYHHVSHEDVSRPEHEGKILSLLEILKPQYIVLAKYMRILSPEFVARFENRIVNIHHSFLPAFAGANPYRQAFERGVKIIGATAHFVTASLDQGPIIAQGVIPVDHTHSAADMAEAGKDVEKIVLARAMKLVLEDRVFVSGNRTVVFD